MVDSPRNSPKREIETVYDEIIDRYNGGVKTKETISEETGRDIDEELEVLVSHGILEYRGHGLYGYTDKVRQYLYKDYNPNLKNTNISPNHGRNIKRLAGILGLLSVLALWGYILIFGPQSII